MAVLDVNRVFRIVITCINFKNIFISILKPGDIFPKKLLMGRLTSTEICNQFMFSFESILHDSRLFNNLDFLYSFYVST